jgi:RimJ/RimL family protein N-acetyltransferase
MPRLFYIADEVKYDWRTQIPDGYTIRPIDKDLLDHEEIPIDVREMILAWENIKDPWNHGIGYVALYEDKIVAHAVIDCIVGLSGDIGLETDQNHQRRGLASVVSAAAIEKALNNGLTKIHWDVSEQNIPSIKTAEKLGLKYQEKHQMFIIEFRNE